MADSLRTVWNQGLERCGTPISQVGVSSHQALVTNLEEGPQAALGISASLPEMDQLSSHSLKLEKALIGLLGHIRPPVAWGGMVGCALIGSLL